MTAWEAALLRSTTSCTFRCGRSSPTSAEVVNIPCRQSFVPFSSITAIRFARSNARCWFKVSNWRAEKCTGSRVDRKLRNSGQTLVVDALSRLGRARSASRLLVAHASVRLARSNSLQYPREQFC